VSASVSRKSSLAIIIPLFNEAEVFPILRQRLETLIRKLQAFYELEVLLIDDGSRDRTWEEIKQFASVNSAVRGVSLSRNFGQQRALFCGYQLAAADVVISLDGDLQDPPELIEKMLGQWKAGFDIVYAVRRSRAGENRFKVLTAFWFYRLLNLVADVKAPLDCGDFRLLSRAALAGLLKMGDKQKYLRGMVGWIGFRSTVVEYDRSPRSAGRTKFDIVRMLRFAFEGITSFSDVPLRVAFVLSIIAPLPFLAYLLYSVFLHLFTQAPLVPGWTSLLLCIVLFGSLNLVSLGIVGVYLGKIFEAIKQRPDYLIASQTGDPTSHARVR
jgi:glycosyltransferase involved in cell wall biosynthesis